ncbi:MAG: DUF2917 domain-containing protein [Betaproteobacteria bacterium]|nr:DUF2917 domain-containing protein [Betaproteobacteria bacterium]
MAQQDQIRKEFTYLRLALAAGEAVSVWASRPLKLDCEQGQLWLTQENSPADHWLRQGDAWRLAAGGQLVVEGAGILRIAGVRRSADFRLRWNDDGAGAGAANPLVRQNDVCAIGCFS